MAEEAVQTGEVHPPGSPEDVQQLMGILNSFFAAKIQAIELYNNASSMADSTGGTKSACNTDGVNDGDDKLPDV